MDRYTHGVVGDEAAALDRLPDLSAPPAGAVRATGTAGPEPDPVRLALCLALPGGKGRTLADSGALREADMLIPESGENPRTTPENGPHLEAAVGFEPTKYGGFANRCLEPLGYAALSYRPEAWTPMPGRITTFGF